MCKTDLDNPGVQRVVRSTRRSATMAKMKTTAREDRRAVRPPVRQGQSYRGKYVCEEPVWQDQRLATADELQTQVSHVPHSIARCHAGLRRDDGPHADHQDPVTEEKTAAAESVCRRKIRMEEALFAAKVAKPSAKWLTICIDDVLAQARRSAIPQWDDNNSFHIRFCQSESSNRSSMCKCRCRFWRDRWKNMNTHKQCSFPSRSSSTKLVTIA